MLGFRRNSKDEEKLENPKDLLEVTDGRTLEELIKVDSSRNCNVYKIDDNYFLTAIKDELYKDTLIENLCDIKRQSDLQSPWDSILPIHNIVSYEGKPIGYKTDSYEMTLRDFFINENPSLTMSKIILKCMRDVLVHPSGHGDIDLVNFVLRDGRIYLTNRFVKTYNKSADMDFLNDIERDLLVAHGHPCNIATPVDEADALVYDYLYYIIVNTTGDERRALIEAGIENIYETLFDDIPNKNVKEEYLKELKRQLRFCPHYEDGEPVKHFYIRLF